MKNNNTYIFALTLVATLGGLLFGYDTAVISGTVESLRKFFIEPQGLPLDQANALEGFVVSSALIGCILGASFAGWISQRYGRKPTLILAAILFLLSAIGSAWPELFIGMPGSGDHTFMYASIDSSLCSFDEPVAPPQPSLPVFPPLSSPYYNLS